MPRAAKASSGKLIMMSAAVKSAAAEIGPVGEFRLPVSRVPAQVRIDEALEHLPGDPADQGRSRPGLPGARREKISLSSSGGIADPSA